MKNDRMPRPPIHIVQPRQHGDARGGEPAHGLEIAVRERHAQLDAEGQGADGADGQPAESADEHGLDGAHAHGHPLAAELPPAEGTDDEREGGGNGEGAGRHIRTAAADDQGIGEGQQQNQPED
jgi:hypothetical protein